MSIFDLLERVAFLRGDTLSLIVMGTAVLVALFLDWRLSLLALTVQYIAAALLFLDVLDARLALVKLVVGLFAALILWITALQLRYGKLPPDLPSAARARLTDRPTVQLGPVILRRSTLLRVGVILTALVIVWLLTTQLNLSLPGFPPGLEHVQMAIIALCGLGLTGLATSRDPLQGGVCLLTFVTGFELFVNAVNQSVIMLGALAALNLGIAVATAYLMQVRRASWYAVLD